MTSRSINEASIHANEDGEEEDDDNFDIDVDMEEEPPSQVHSPRVHGPEASSDDASSGFHLNSSTTQASVASSPTCPIYKKSISRDS